MNQKSFSQIIHPVFYSAGFKILVIAFLLLLLLIPAAMISELIWERTAYQNRAVSEIASKWGRAQTIAGPVLHIPFRKLLRVNKDGEEEYESATLNLLADEVVVDVKTTPQVRRRGIYETVVYEASLRLQARWNPLEPARFGFDEKNLNLKKVHLSVGVSDIKGIGEISQIKLNEGEILTEPGLLNRDLFQSGFHSTYFTLSPLQTNLVMEFKLRGSQDFFFVPTGRKTVMTVSSSWKNPSFQGSFLPLEKKLHENGFEARWEVLDLNRNFPQLIFSSTHSIQQDAFGVSFYIPADLYQQTTRVVKYALMFILFTFATFFVMEISKKTRIHPIQYLMVGLCILLFYVLLLSISEHLGFTTAYMIAAIATILCIGGYSKSIFRNETVGGTVSVILIVLYAYLYMMLKLEDYALLAGSLGLFSLLSFLMYYTRKFDWYDLSKEPGKDKDFSKKSWFSSSKSNSHLSLEQKVKQIRDLKTPAREFAAPKQKQDQSPRKNEPAKNPSGSVSSEREPKIPQEKRNFHKEKSSQSRKKDKSSKIPPEKSTSQDKEKIPKPEANKEG